MNFYENVFSVCAQLQDGEKEEKIFQTLYSKLRNGEKIGFFIIFFFAQQAYRNALLGSANTLRAFPQQCRRDR